MRLNYRGHATVKQFVNGVDICYSLFGHMTFFVASLVFMKGTSCCVIKRNCEIRPCKHNDTLQAKCDEGL